MKSLILISILLFSVSCTNYYDYPTYSENGNVFMVVEIPAGTSDKFEYNSIKNKFEQNIVNEDELRRIEYLPYPGNYGFIPSTLMDESRGGDGDPLDVIAIGSTIKKGSILEIIPVGVLKMYDNGEEDHKILGVVVNSKTSTISCNTLQCIEEKYSGILKIIELWFKNYKPESVVELHGWEDEKKAEEMIEKWSL